MVKALCKYNTIAEIPELCTKENYNKIVSRLDYDYCFNKGSLYEIIGVTQLHGILNFYLISDYKCYEIDIGPAVLFDFNWTKLPENWRARMCVTVQENFELLPERLSVIDHWFEKYIDADPDVVAAVRAEIDEICKERKLLDVFENLKRYAKMASEDDIPRFERAVSSLAETKDPEVLKKLMIFFDDNCPYYEAMHSLLLAIEGYPHNIYVSAVLENISDILDSAPEWAETIINRIFKDDECCQIFVKNMSLAPKQALLKLFDLMESESSEHYQLIQSLRTELEKQ